MKKNQKCHIFNFKIESSEWQVILFHINTIWAPSKIPKYIYEKTKIEHFFFGCEFVSGIETEKTSNVKKLQQNDHLALKWLNYVSC